MELALTSPPTCHDRIYVYIYLSSYIYRLVYGGDSFRAELAKCFSLFLLAFHLISLPLCHGWLLDLL